MPASDPNTLYDIYRAKVAGTTIDERTLLSTDYFNSFNEVVMLLGMAADCPDVLEDIKAWKFRTYAEHFQESTLAFGPLAVEAYEHAPSAARAPFDMIADELRFLIEESQQKLVAPQTDDETYRLKVDATSYARQLQELIERGSGIVHGAGLNLDGPATSLDQSAIDALF